MTTPGQYRDLPGFGVFYSETELRLAVAIAEAFIENSLGGGGGGGGGVGDASAANQLTEIARLEAIRDRLPTALVSNRLPVDLPSVALASGSSFIGRQGIRGFRASANFVRPSDTTAYTNLDAITNSTSAPTTLSTNLNTFGANNGDFICFTNARIISSVAQATLLTGNIFIFNQTFAATNDNAQLSIDDATAQTGGVVIPCLNTYNLSANARSVSDPGQWIMRLADTSTSIFFALQATNAYTPASSERFDVILEGFLL